MSIATCVPGTATINPQRSRERAGNTQPILSLHPQPLLLPLTGQTEPEARRWGSPGDAATAGTPENELELEGQT